MQDMRVAVVVVETRHASFPNSIETDFVAISLAKSAMKCGWGLYDTTILATTSFTRNK
jgi:hypothetical protein